MIDCGFYAVCGLNMLLGRICDGCHSQGYDAPGLFDLVVIFVNVCVQGHDAPSERDFSIALLQQSGCVNESFNKMVEMNFQSTHLDTKEVAIYSLLHLPDDFSVHLLTCGVSEEQSTFLL